MTSNEPARTGRRTRSTVFIGFACLVPLLSVAALAASRPHLTGKERYLSPDGWTGHAQGALVLGHGRPEVSPLEQAVPIASLAKVMTAYLTHKYYPLSGAQEGFTITVTADQAQAEVEDAAQDQLVVAV
jgi:serine-type D-Ala-D-Ala carboxypeptidase (penicillin-binding protein 5/6)